MQEYNKYDFFILQVDISVQASFIPSSLFTLHALTFSTVKEPQ